MVAKFYGGKTARHKKTRLGGVAQHGHEEDHRQRYCAYLPHGGPNVDDLGQESPGESEAQHGERHHEVVHVAV